MLNFHRTALAMISPWLFLLLILSPAKAIAYGEVRINLVEKFKVSGCPEYKRKTQDGSVFALNDDASWIIYDLKTSYANLNAGSYTGSYESKKITLTANDFREAFGLLLNTVTNASCKFSEFEKNRFDPLIYKLKINKRGTTVKMSSKGKFAGIDAGTGEKKSGRWSISGKGSYKNKPVSADSQGVQGDSVVIGNIKTDPSVYGLWLDGFVEVPIVDEESEGSSGFVAFTSNGFFLFISF